MGSPDYNVARASKKILVGNDANGIPKAYSIHANGYFIWYKYNSFTQLSMGTSHIMAKQDAEDKLNCKLVTVEHVEEINFNEL